ncbi:hypothetical protein D3C73_1302290 [compost metagenome]
MQGDFQRRQSGFNRQELDSHLHRLKPGAGRELQHDCGQPDVTLHLNRQRVLPIQYSMADRFLQTLLAKRDLRHSIAHNGDDLNAAAVHACSGLARRSGQVPSRALRAAIACWLRRLHCPHGVCLAFRIVASGVKGDYTERI